MKHKQTWLTRGSFALLLFVILGYVVKFYPEQLTNIDQPIQAGIRGDLPRLWTNFFATMTQLANIPVIISWVLIFVLFFLWKNWQSEALYVAGNLALSGLLVSLLKQVYQRPRPSISHLVQETGFSFPSGHSLAATLVFGSLIVVMYQRIQKKPLRYLMQGMCLLLIGIVLVSRVYLGVHYPSDVLGGALLGFGVLCLEYPFYDEWRFKRRFTRKQS
ncbi:phosphatase PAP2 family protein [Streptococcus himalayensis]|uniref:Phosphatase PAP2 family protein n=1 Tax=Streptococcus himalayensis TaxID=1888195 RepID=A0A917A6R9_9STRE|nr:phosphatase PAP2 family protein [Streptococcus himalayensis]GGE31358.1 phosphatase PAP2 family protein [Streptococcus himalayensis]